MKYEEVNNTSGIVHSRFQSATKYLSEAPVRRVTGKTAAGLKKIFKKNHGGKCYKININKDKVPCVAPLRKTSLPHCLPPASLHAFFPYLTPSLVSMPYSSPCSTSLPFPLPLPLVFQSPDLSSLLPATHPSPFLSLPAY